MPADNTKTLIAGTVLALLFFKKGKNQVWLLQDYGYNLADYADNKTQQRLPTYSWLGYNNSTNSATPMLVGYWDTDQDGNISGGVDGAGKAYLIFKNANQKNVWHRLYETDLPAFASSKQQAIKQRKEQLAAEPQ